MGDERETAAVLDRLFAVIDSRRGGDVDASYTARLLAAGPARAAQKLGEEAVETVIAGVSGGRAELAAESADLLYHLLTLWAARGVAPDQVWRELAAREGRSGLDERAQRESRRADAE